MSKQKMNQPSLLVKETLGLYWRYVRLNLPTALVMLVSIPVAAAIIDSILPFLLSQAIGEIMSGGQKIDIFLWLSAATGAVGAILNYVGFRAMVHQESFMLKELRNATFSALIQKDNAFFVNQKIGAMTSKYIDFVRSYISIQDLFIIRTLSFVLTVGSGLVIVALTSWLVSLILFLFIVILSLEIRWSARHRAEWRHERKSLVATIHGEVADALTNNLVVRSYAGETRETKTISKLTDKFSHIYKKDIGFAMTEGSVRVLLMVFTQVLSIAVSAYLIRNGAMNLATGIFILAYMQRIGSQLFALGDIINGYDQAFLEAQPMTEMLLTPNHVEDRPQATSLQHSKGNIEFRSMSFRYDDGISDVIHDMSLAIPAGRKIGLVGHSGAGKSTVIQLLLRFNDATGGSITIDGHDIRDITQKSLRENISYVPQEPLLFHRTLRENIAYGHENANEDEIILAAKQANAWEFIQELPDGLDTTVGERGIKLSGGQRQRIAIARAILKNAPILILDEATSALDSESEKLIQQSLGALMKDRTSIVIAHRLSTIAKLDRIVVLDHGRIVEDGTHAQLLKQNGIYAKLWTHQSGGFIEE